MTKGQPDIPVGYVRRPHGIGGDVVVRGMISDADDRLVEGATLATDEQPSRGFEVLTRRVHRGDYLLSLAGVGDRGAAEALVGIRFVIDSSERRQLEEGEWWAEDLIGCAVLRGDGSPVGSVVDVIAGAAQDRLLIATASGVEFEVPLVDELVPDLDPDNRRVVVELPEGLMPQP